MIQKLIQQKKQIRLFFVFFFFLFSSFVFGNQAEFEEINPNPTVFVNGNVNVVRGSLELFFIDLFGHEEKKRGLTRTYTSKDPSGWNLFFQESDFLLEEQSDEQNFFDLFKNSVFYKWNEEGQLGLVQGTFVPLCRYFYAEKEIDGKKPLIKIEYANQEYLEIEYYEEGWNEIEEARLFLEAKDDRIGKVKKQKICRLSDLFPKTMYSFFYEPGTTTVLDGNGNKTIYHHEEDCLTKIEHFEDHFFLYRSESLYWKSKQEKKLAARVVQNGKNEILMGRTFQYNEKGKISSDTLVGDFSGKVSSFLEFDERTLSFVDPIEEEVTFFHYDENERLISKKNRLTKKEVVYEYAANERIASEIFSDQEKIIHRIFYTYDDQKRIVCIKEDKGTAKDPFDYENVKEQKLVFITYGAQKEKEVEMLFFPETDETKILKETTFSYVNGGLQGQVKDFSFDEPVTFFWEENEKKQKIKEGCDDVTFFYYLYDLFGNCIQKKDLVNDITYSFGYDFSRHLLFTKSELADGRVQKQSYTYDLLGNVIAVRDSYENETEIERDFCGRIKKVSYPLVPLGKEAAIRPSIEYVFDELDHMIEIIDPLGYSTKKEYNLYGQTTYSCYPDGTIGSEEKNSSLSLNKTDFPFDFLKETPEQEKVIRDFFHFLGYHVKEIETCDEKGDILLVQKDALGRILVEEKKNPFGLIKNRVEREYDPVGHITKEIQFRYFKGELIGSFGMAYLYGPMNRIEEVMELEEDFVKRRQEYFYDPYGRIDTIIKPDGISLFYQYDDQGRLLIYHGSDGSFGYQFIYDEEGKIVETMDLVHGIHQKRLYAEDGCLLEEKISDPVLMQYRYDETKKCKEIIYPDFSKVHHLYQNEQIKEIQRISKEDKLVYRYDYLDFSSHHTKLSAHLIGDLGKIEWKYDEQNRLKEIVTPFTEEKIVYDQENVMTVSYSSPKGNRSNSYLYDDESRCIGEIKGIHYYDYDSCGNRYEIGETISNVNNFNERVKEKDSFFHFDQNGNLIKKMDPDKTIFYEYDALNRLIKMQEGKKSVEYIYDAFGRRIIKKTEIDQDLIKEFFLYQGDHEVGICKENGEILELRVLGMGLGAEIGGAISFEKENHIYAPLHDFQGNVTALVDIETKEIVETYEYTVFGEETIFDHHGKKILESRCKNPWRYSSKRVDSETGFIFFGKRYYIPSLGRWLTKDPAGLIDGINLYAFLKNNPVNHVDLYGLFSWKNAWENIQTSLQKFFQKIGNFALDIYSFFKKHIPSLQSLRESGDLILQEFLSRSFLQFSGYYIDETRTGIYGSYEVDSLVRITLINGILNSHQDCLSFAKLISETHGGVNVHYVFRPTYGWSWDLCSGFQAKILGITSTYAKKLASLWKELIEELGGPESGGMIYHYAHSLGTVDTFSAKKLLTEEERKMIHVISFGSPILSFDYDFGSLVHYISKGDGVPFLSWMRWSSSHLSSEHIHLIDSSTWMPFVDHLIENLSYSSICRSLGEKFIQNYGMV